LQTMSESAVKRILVGDPEPEIRRKLTDFFKMTGYRVDAAENGQEALSMVAAHDYAVILLEYRLSEGDGLDILAKLSTSHPEISVIMLSAEPTLEIVITALRKGAFDFVVKPFDLTELTEIVHKAAEQNELLKMYRAISTKMRQERDTGSQRGASSQKLLDKYSVGTL
jgi:two-component system response regulator AtoC